MQIVLRDSELIYKDVFNILWTKHTSTHPSTSTEDSIDVQDRKWTQTDYNLHTLYLKWHTISFEIISHLFIDSNLIYRHECNLLIKWENV